MPLQDGAHVATVLLATQEGLVPVDDPIIDGGSTAADTDPVGEAIAALTPDAIRNSPEYKTILNQNRTLARQAGAAQREAEKARAAAEQARQAAEAQSQADLEAELVSTLGEDGIAAYNEIADLSQTDPRAAARRLATLMSTARVQSSGEAQPAAGQPAPAQGGTAVPLVPPAPRRVDAGAPLNPGPATDPTVALIGELEGKYQSVVDRNNNSATRNRVTMRDRADGLISYLAAAYLKSGARPRSDSR